ncbi:MAG: hypothetical protein LBR24_02000 [Methanobrevibacter sp.]|jgi:beta-galactosidase/beta-glucuronidase|nr:hypothetical protein [Methanobrevibacter sp.]
MAVSIDDSYGKRVDSKTKIASSKAIKSIKIKGNDIIVIYKNKKKQNFTIKGLCYSRGDHGQSYYKYYKYDIKKLKAINANTIRTYRPLAAYKKNGQIDYKKTKKMLDAFAKNGIYVVVGFDSVRDITGGYNDGQYFKAGVYKTYIKKFAKHPAILMWAFGNEYNYHYNEWFKNKAQWMKILSTAAKKAKKLSPTKLVATVHGEVPSSSELKEYKTKKVDLVMVNIYRGASFGNLFTNWAEITAKSKMPLVISEFGRSSQSGSKKDTSLLQSNTLKSLWNEIIKNKNITAGGFIFELNDESWKGQKELSSIIGSEAHLGIFKSKTNNYKKDAKLAAKTISKLWKGKLK